jgi:hypothetical protein
MQASRRFLLIWPHALNTTAQQKRIIVAQHVPGTSRLSKTLTDFLIRSFAQHSLTKFVSFGKLFGIIQAVPLFHYSR